MSKQALHFAERIAAKNLLSGSATLLASHLLQDILLKIIL